MSSISLLKKLVTDLENAAEAAVLEAVFHPPLPAAELLSLQENYKLKLPSDLEEFYRACNGFSLYWKFAPNLNAAQEKQLQRELKRHGLSELNRKETVGSVRIIGLAQCLSKELISTVTSPGTDDLQFEFRGTPFTYGTMAEILRPFDRFDTKTDFSCAAFVFDGNKDKTTVMLLTDYYADWRQSRLSDFETYVQILVASKAIPAIRMSIYESYRGDKIPLMVFDEQVKKQVEFKLG